MEPLYYYRADADYTGADTFTWKCNDGDKDSNTATCTVTINGNTPPIAINQSVTTDCGLPVAISLSRTESDPGQVLTYALVNGPNHGGLVHASDTYRWTYTSDNDYAGADTFTWKCNDGADDSNVATCAITVNAVLPVPQNQTACVRKNTVTDIPALYTGGGGYTFTVAAGHATVTCSGTTFTYTPVPDFTGVDTFAWRVRYEDGTYSGFGNCTVHVMEDTGSDDWPMWRFDEHRSGMTLHALPDDLHLQWTLELPPIAPGFTQIGRADVVSDVRHEYCHEPVVLGDTMLIPSSRNDMLLAIGTDTGAERWRYYTEGPIRAAPAAYRLDSGQARVYVASDDGYLHCLDAATGGLVWKKFGGPSTRKCVGFDRLISVWPCMSTRS